MKAAERLDREQIEALQRRRLNRIVRMAREKSPYYAEQLAGLPMDFELADLPILTQANLRSRFDDIVTDRRLKYEDVDRFIMALQRNETYLGEYRALFTSGTTGERGTTVYGAKDWVTHLALLVRGRTMAGAGGQFLARRRSASIANPSVAAPPRQSTGTLRNPLNKLFHLSTNQPLTRIAAQLQDFQPEVLSADAMLLFLLARMQVQGRLAISPGVLWSASEVLSPTMKDTIEKAWGTTPYDVYGTTETGMLGSSCERREGFHLYEDYFIFEVVDENHRHVAPGETGRRLLVTNLYNETLPQIRYELTDHVTLAHGPCPCGRTLQLISAVSGREAEVIYLSGKDGSEVAIAPFYLLRLPRAAPGVLQTQFVFEGGILSVSLTVSADADAEAAQANARAYLEETLADLGAVVPTIVTGIVEEIPKNPVSGKTLLVINRDVQATVER